MNLFSKYRGNPDPSKEVIEGDEPYGPMHASIWRFLLHLDKRQAITDERVLFIMRWMVPTVLVIELLILGYLIGT